jgi:ABC-type phosphate transport system substrate-binding protein
MLRLSRKKRIGARASILAGATAAVLAVAGVGAGSASAALSCTGSNIVGQGSSLQKVAEQEVWAPTFASSICNKGTFPTVTYNSTGSGGGLKEWNHDGKLGHINTAIQFIGTDDAPTAAQIANITGVTSGASLAVVPVAQTAISVPANPPAECTITQIKNIDLEKVMKGVYLTWSQIPTASGAGCNSPITRVVRKDGSGTTFQFKNYLFKSNTASLPCISKTWQELEPITNGETGAPNTSWPESCAGKTLSPVLKPANNGGGEVVKTVLATSGSIGYAALPDAKGNGATLLLELQNNGQKTEGATYAAPGAIGGVANCEGQQYEVPLDARNQEGHTGLNVDWSQVFGGNPGIGSTTYPLCTLTYNLAFHNYKGAGFTFKNEVTVHDYITEFLVKETGQEALAESEKFYAKLPQSEKLKFNVLGSAKFVAAKISFE